MFMAEVRPQRIRDPVHGLIAFANTAVDQLAWSPCVSSVPLGGGLEPGHTPFEAE
jgi:hypothetical protein